MIRYISLSEALAVYSRVIHQSGGRAGIHDLGGLESALVQPRMIFAGEELYPTIVEKAAVIGFSVIQNHPFVDGTLDCASYCNCPIIRGHYNLNFPQLSATHCHSHSARQSTFRR